MIGVPSNLAQRPRDEQVAYAVASMLAFALRMELRPKRRLKVLGSLAEGVAAIERQYSRPHNVVGLGTRQALAARDEAAEVMRRAAEILGSVLEAERDGEFAAARRGPT